MDRLSVRHVFVLLPFVYHLIQGVPVAGGEGSIAASADDVIQPAVKWLLDRRLKPGANDNGWGVDTPRALLTLLRVDAAHLPLERTAVDWDLKGVQGQLCRQQFDIQLLLFLLKNRGSYAEPEKANTLARYALTLASMCRNPRDFYDEDIIAPILTIEEEELKRQQPFTFAFNALAVCAGGGHVKRRHVVRLLEFVNQSPAETHNIDVLSMVAMATACLSRSSAKYHHLQDYLELPLKMIAAQQMPDGSFDGNLPTTALAIQALQLPEYLTHHPGRPADMKPVPLVPWRLDKSLEWIRSLQRADGSFGGDLFVTAEVLLALSGRGYGTIDRCTMNQTIADNSTATVTTTTPIPSAGPIGNLTGMVHFTYVVWVGQDRREIYTIKLTIPANTSFYEAMKIAAEADPHFQFSATVWPNGHFIHTIAGHKDQNIGFHFWLLFNLPYSPDPENPPPVTGDHNVAIAGVDDMYPKEGEYYLFWYKDV